MKHLPPLPLLLGLALVLPHGATANGAPPDGQAAVESKAVKAAYIYNFTKFVDWPAAEAAPDQAPPPITICVVGSDPVAVALDEVGALQSRGRPIKVVHVGGREAIPPCHVLYIGVSEEPQLPRILGQVQKAGILTVSDIPGFVEQGGMIGFFLERGRVRIEINDWRARLVGLRISSKLLEIARITPGGLP